MIKNYLLVTLRSLMKSKLYIFINIIGLSVAIGCGIVAYFNYEFDVTYNDHHINAENIYRVSSIREFNDVTTLYGYVPLPLGAAVKENIPDVDHAVRYAYSYSNFKVKDDLFPGNLAYVDADFFTVFTFEMLHGTSESIKDKSKVLINDEMAIRLFGATDVVGKAITQVYGTEEKEIEVGGVFKRPPSNNSFRNESYLLYDGYFDEFQQTHEDEWKDRATLFLMIKDESRLTSIHEQLQPFTENNNQVREDFLIKEFVLDPFVGMARRDADNDTASWTWDASPKAAVLGPSLMAVFILLIACFNLTNTSISVASRRLKEIGIRKVMGGLRSQLIIQFIGETVVICFVALLIGLVLGEVLLSAWNNLWTDMKLTSHYADNAGFLIFIIAVLLFTAILAGSYPAFYISGFEPVSILKGKSKFGGTNLFTKVLLVLQYTISLIAVVHAIAFAENARYQRDFDLGFDQHGVIISYINNEGEFNAYRDALAQNPEIRSIAGSTHSIYSGRYNDPVKVGTKQLEVDILDVGDQYLETFGLTLLEGRNFRKDSETDRKESVIITKSMADRFEWTDPIGKELIWMDTVKLYVVGVVKDVYNRGLWREMEPMMMRYTSPDKYSHLIVSAPVEKISDINSFMEQKWKELFSNRLYNGRMIGEEAMEMATVNNNILKMFLFLGAVALILSATGLFSLVSLNIIKRMKEIGVRKVLGASIFNITRIINLEVVIILVFAALLGSLGAYFLVDSLMGSIWDYYQAATTTTFVISILLLFVISGLTIGFKVYGAATTNPVNTLRDE